MERSGILASVLQTRGYQVTRPLKGTSQCSVYCVRQVDDPSQEISVAKVVTLAGLDAKGRASAQQEVSLLKGLAAHPNLIAYRESFVEDANGAGILFIVMSLAEDGDLRRVVTESQAIQRLLPEQVVLSWLYQTLAGLAHLHSQGVVHRDLKSSNIFLCEGRRRIRIGDFGISRVLESTAFASSCVGTPAYMSPELMRNERYDTHVDMWALGCISYELCTLSLPFTASSLLDLVFQVVETEPDWTKLSTNYSEYLQDITRRLLQKDVAKRPEAMQILAEPLFAQGAPDVSDELWAYVAPETWAEPSLGKMSAWGGATPTEMTTADTGTGGKSSLCSNGVASNGSWSDQTPGSDGANTAFQNEIQAARSAQRELSKDEFQTMLCTYREQMLEEIKAAHAGLPAPASAAVGPAPPQVHESVM